MANLLSTTFSSSVSTPSSASTFANFELHSQTGVIDIAFKVQSRLAFQKRAARPANTNNEAAYSKTYGKRTWNKQSDYAIEIRSSTSTIRLTRHRSRSPPVLFTPRLNSTQYRTLLQRLRRYHRLLHSLARFVKIFLT